MGAQVVWKRLPNKELQPVMVRLGVTDYTFTELKGIVGNGELKPGDELIIGQSTGASPTQSGATARPPGTPGASPVGGPGGMRRM
jgi:hypothetical protein